MPSERTLSRRRVEDVAPAGELELLAAARAGSLPAFRQLVQRYQKLACSFAYGLTGNSLESEEVAQEAFVTAWRRLPEVDPERFRPWLCGVVRMISRRFRWRRHNRPDLVPIPAPDSNEEIASSDPSPLDQAMSRQEVGAVRRALRAIPEIYRLPLVLFYGEQQSLEEIAEALLISPDTARKRLSRGRRLLQKEVATFVPAALGRPGQRKDLVAGVMALVAMELRTAEASPPRAMRAAKRGAGRAFVPGAAAVLAMPAAIFGFLAVGKEVSPRAVSTGRLPVAPAAASFRAAPPPVPLLGGALPGALPLAVAPADPLDEGVQRLPIEYDFEDGRRPSLTSTHGQIAPCPDRPASLHCMAATVPFIMQKGMPFPHYLVTFLEKKYIRHSPRLVLGFDYWAGDGPLMVTLRQAVSRQQFVLDVDVVRRTWTHVEVRISDFKPRAPGTPTDAALQDGERLSDLDFAGGRIGSDNFYLDNITVAER